MFCLVPSACVTHLIKIHISTYRSGDMRGWAIRAGNCLRETGAWVRRQILGETGQGGQRAAAASSGAAQCHGNSGLQLGFPKRCCWGGEAQAGG